MMPDSQKRLRRVAQVNREFFDHPQLDYNTSPRRLEQTRLHRIDPRAVVQGRPRVKVVRDPETGRALYVEIPTHPVFTGGPSKVPEDTTMDPQWAWRVEPTKNPSPLSDLAWEHAFPTQQPTFSETGEQISSPLPETFVDQLPRDLLNLGRNIPELGRTTQERSGKYRWFTDKLSDAEGLQWFDPAVLPEDEEASEMTAKQRTLEPWDPTEDRDPDRKVSRPELDGAIETVRQAWMGRDPQAPQMVAKFLNDFEFPLYYYMMGKLAFALRDQDMDGNEAEDIPAEALSSVRRVLSQAFGTGRYESSKTATRRGWYVFDYIDSEVRRILAKIKRGYGSGLLGGTDQAVMSEIEDSGTGVERGRTSEFMSEMGSSRQAIYDSLMEQYGEQANETFSELTQEFQAFLLEQSTNLPGMSPVEKDGSLNESYMTMLSNVDLSDPQIIPDRICPYCGLNTMTTYPRLDKSVCSTEGCRAFATVEVKDPEATSPEKRFKISGGVDPRTASVRKDAFKAALPAFLQVKRAALERENQRSLVQEQSGEMAPSVAANLRKRNNAMIAFMEQIPNFLTVQVYGSGDNYSGIRSNNPPRLFVFKPMGQFEDGQFISSGRGAWYPVSPRHPDYKQYLGVDPQEFLSGPSYPSSFGIGADSGSFGNVAGGFFEAPGTVKQTGNVIYSSQANSLMPLLLRSSKLGGEDLPMPAAEFSPKDIKDAAGARRKKLASMLERMATYFNQQVVYLQRVVPEVLEQSGSKLVIPLLDEQRQPVVDPDSGEMIDKGFIEDMTDFKVAFVRTADGNLQPLHRHLPNFWRNIVQGVKQRFGVVLRKPEEEKQFRAEVERALDTSFQMGGGEAAAMEELLPTVMEQFATAVGPGPLPTDAEGTKDEKAANNIANMDALARTNVLADLVSLSGGLVGFGGDFTPADGYVKGIDDTQREGYFTLHSLSQRTGMPIDQLETALEQTRDIIRRHYLGPKTGQVVRSPNPGVAVNQAIRFFLPTPIKEAFFDWHQQSRSQMMYQEKPLVRAARFVVGGMDMMERWIAALPPDQQVDENSLLQQFLQDPNVQEFLEQFPEVGERSDLLAAMMNEAVANEGPTARAARYLRENVGTCPRCSRAVPTVGERAIKCPNCGTSVDPQQTPPKMVSILDMADRYAANGGHNLRHAQQRRTGDGDYRIVLFANDDHKRARGLMFTEPLGDDECALFVFHHPADHRFWNKNVSYPLSLAFCDANGRVVAKRHMDADSTEGCSPGRTDVKYVIEARMGLLDDVTEGDRFVVREGGGSLRFIRG